MTTRNEVTQHTPTPWLVDAGKSDVVLGGNCNPLQFVSHDSRNADAAHIVRCVNAHDDLVDRIAMLERALQAIINTNPVADYVLDIHALEIRNIARAALAKVGS